MDRQIQLYLLGVGKRFRRVRFGWLLAAVWLFLAGGLWAVRESRADSPALVSWTWIVGLAVAALVWFLNRSAFRDWNWLANRVEETYPDLKQRLLTAIESPSPETVSPALRRQLINDTVRHARTHRWEGAVSSMSLLSAWGGQLLCLMVAVGTSWISIPGRDSIAGNDSSNADLLYNGQGLVVEPGDIEIERGTDVVVSARYDGELLDSLLLVATPMEPKEPESGQETESLRVPMRRSLKDPVFGGYLRGVATELRYRVEAGKLASQEYKVKVFDYPALVRSDAKIVPPVYANQEERIVEDTRRVTVPEGTSLQWTCFVNKPVEEAELVDQSGLAVPLVPSAEDPLKLVATFQIDENRQWTLHLADNEKRKAKYEEKLSAKVLRNNVPDIKLAKAQDLQVSPLQEVALQATVSDDFSLKRSGISFTLGESEPSEIELQPVVAQKGKLQVSHSLDLESSQAKPDQLLSYFFWAEDLDSEGNPRRVEGDMFFAEVRPFEEIFREGEAPSPKDQQQQQQQQQQQSQAGQQAEKLAELQKKIISGTWNSIRREKVTKPSSNFADDTKVLQESQSQALEQTAELEESIQDSKSGDYLVEVRESMKDAVEKLQEAITLADPASLREALKSERKAYEGLLKLRAREHNVVQSQRQQSSSRSQQSGAQQDRQEQLQQLELADQQNQYESQQKAEEESEKGPDRETRQVMNRLDELARRQKDLNEQLKTLENALREAKTPEEKQSVEEQLARLREDQEEMVRDADELLERMNQPENRQAMEQSRQQVEQAREQLQQSSQSLSQGQTSPALSSGTRAERQMEETREQLRQESSNQMEQSIRSMVQQAKEVEKKQKELEQKVAPDSNTSPADGSSERESDASPLRPEGTSEEVGKSPAQEWKEQKERVQQLLQSVQEAVSEAESSEPLLAEQLYETFRESKQSGLEKQLDEIPRLIERGMEEPAKEKAQGASESIEKLREGIEQASEKVLGSERESLRRALRELDRARNELQDEIQANSPSDNPTASQQGENPTSNQPTGESREGTRSEGDGSKGNREEANPQSPNQGDRPNTSNQPSEEEPNSRNNPTPGENPSTISNPRDESKPSLDFPPNGIRPNDNRGAGNRETRGGNEPREGRSRVGATTGGVGLGNERPVGAAPLTGEEYRAWMDRLRDVEELVSDPELKAEVARIREAAREMRVEYKRHSKEPQWPLVRRLLAEPLSQLREQVNAELLRQAAEKNAIVPIDRDPVPSNFQRQLDKYYENLGSGKPR